MRRSLPLLVVLTALLFGCGKTLSAKDTAASNSADTPTKEVPKDTMETSRQGIHEGAFQLSNAAQDLQTAIDAAKTLFKSTKNPDLKAALTDLLGALDDAGASIADFTAEPPELEKFKEEFAALDQKRLDAIDGGNDALHDVNDASDMIGDFTDNPDPADATGLSDLDDALSNAADDLTDAIKAFGGKPEEDDTQDITPDPNAKDDPNAPVTPDLKQRPQGDDF